MTRTDRARGVPAPRPIQNARQARSIRAGILLARGRDLEPLSSVDGELADAAFVRTRVRAGLSRR